MDVGKITNSAMANTYASKETNKENDVKKYSVSGTRRRRAAPPAR